MKEELEKYGKGDLVLCKNGVYVLVVSVDPLSKLKRHDGERYLEYMKGFSSKSTKKSNLFDSDTFTIESSRDSSVITIDTSSRYKILISDLIKNEATVLGRLSKDKLAAFDRFIG